MCLGGPPAIDTSAQTAEAARQREADDARAANQLQAQKDEAAAQRAQQEAESAAQLKAQQDADARQAALQQQQIDAQNKAAADARAATEKRAADVATYTAGRSARSDALTGQINDAFSGFNDDYFNNFRQSYLNYYNPQIENQAKEANRQTTLELADQGNLDSSAASRIFGQLAGKKADEQSTVANDAIAQSNNLRQQVNSQRQNLLSQALSSSVIGDPNAVPDDINAGLSAIDSNVAAFRPTIATGASIAPPSFTALGDIFAGLVPQGGGFTGAGIAGLPRSLFSNPATPQNQGALRVVS